jgi:ribosomal protein L37AE/L43A
MLEDIIEGLFDFIYTCPECGKKMKFETENEDVLVCEHCGYSVEAELYGEEEYGDWHPSLLNHDKYFDD